MCNKVIFELHTHHLSLLTKQDQAVLLLAFILSINLEFNISRSFRLDLGVSKRFTQDLDLINTDSDEFENLNYYITLKIGGF